jgi:hypothetical protein
MCGLERRVRFKGGANRAAPGLSMRELRPMCPTLAAAFSTMLEDPGARVLEPKPCTCMHGGGMGGDEVAHGRAQDPRSEGRSKGGGSLLCCKDWEVALPQLMHGRGRFCAQHPSAPAIDHTAAEPLCERESTACPRSSLGIHSVEDTLSPASPWSLLRQSWI